MDDISRPFFSSIMLGDTNWQIKLKPYIEGYFSVKKMAQVNFDTFPQFLHYKAMNIYLWTKYNWEGEIAPGSMKTKDWLAVLHKMVIDQEWKNQLISVMKNIVL